MRFIDRLVGAYFLAHPVYYSYVLVALKAKDVGRTPSYICNRMGQQLSDPLDGAVLR